MFNLTLRGRFINSAIQRTAMQQYIRSNWIAVRNMSYLKDFHKKTNVFDKYHYNPNHIPKDVVCKNTTKVKKEFWTNPDPNYKHTIRPPTQHLGRTLITMLEKEEIKNEFKFPDFRPGDVIEVQYYVSLSEKKVNTYKGLCTGVENKKGINYAVQMVAYVDGINIKLHLKLHSPLFISLEVVKFGSNHNRNRLNHVWYENWAKSRVESPIIKGKGFAKRGKTLKRRRNILGDFGDHILHKKSTRKEKLSDRSMILDDTQ
ncbi:unnamed protein product [Moneuplotes crassus]|uniref:50S ribosomal protein L19, chloroplastic n=1 Tax=Euplotes crassus TaxID=5936 RepID=A0AAD1XJU2_EUPCR|nr:unnamed protein product [Moneuplotes crassus]